jgi:tight adherence protein B
MDLFIHYGPILKFLGYILIFICLVLGTYSYSERFLDWLRFQSIGTRDYIVDRLKLMSIDRFSPERILAFQAVLSLGPAVFLFLIIYPEWPVGLIAGSLVGLLGWKAPKPIVDFLYDRRVDEFVLQMVDGLNLMSNGLKSGMSIPQSMDLVVKEMPNPMRQEFSMVLSQVQMGASLEDAFNDLAKRVQSDDVEMFVTSINILKETGGNLAETFDTITTTIRERVKLEKKIQAMTAMGYYQGMLLMAIPPLLGIVFYTTDPEFMKPLFTTGMGWAILLGIVALEVAGFFVISKVIKIDV